MSGLNVDIVNWSDGYKVTSTLTLLADGSRGADLLLGTCAVNMYDDLSTTAVDWKTDELRTGILCHIIQSASGTATSLAANGHNLIWTKTLAIPSWTALTSTSLPTFVQTLTGLGIIQNPVNTSAEQASIFTAQTFSMSWYQPKFLYQESGYILMRRFSALDRIQTYVLSETSASSLNGATLCTAEQVTLAGAAALTAITAGLNFLLFAM